MPKIKIDDREVEVPPGGTILEAARKLGIDVPTLCHFEGYKASTSCLVCMGLLLTLISLAKTAYCARWVSDPRNLGTFAVSFLPFLYCLAFAEIVCPVLSHHFGCRVERHKQAASDANSVAPS